MKSFRLLVIVSVLALALVPALALGAEYMNNELGFTLTYPENYKSTGEEYGARVLQLKPEGKQVPDISVVIVDNPSGASAEATVAKVVEATDGMDAKIVSSSGNRYVVEFDYMGYALKSVLVLITKGDKAAGIVFTGMASGWDKFEAPLNKMADGVKIK